MTPTAWREGYNARKADRRRTENPYIDLKPQSPRAEQWDDGWRFADTWTSRIAPSPGGRPPTLSPAAVEVKMKKPTKKSAPVSKRVSNPAS